MGQRLKEVDAYIERAPEYARPILKKVRSLVHKADPSVSEAIKWGNPAFERDGLVCGVAAFKNYVGLGFWHHQHLKHPAARALETTKIATLDDLPADEDLIACVREAVALNTSGAKPKRAPAKPKAPLPMPADFAAALKKNAKARAAFDAFPPSHRREYIEWITEAKREETRTKRLEQAVAWIAQGKSRNWKYQ